MSISSSSDSSYLGDVSQKLARASLGDTPLEADLQLLRSNIASDDFDELSASPIFTEPVRQYSATLTTNTHQTPFTQYGLFGGVSKECGTTTDISDTDPRVFYNTVSPSSVFICGSQGSGKSHTLGCLLENCLTPSDANVLPRPLTGIIFHYDPWVSDSGGSPCEAAHLSAARGTSVRVLCAPTNIKQIKRIYADLPNVQVEELRISQSDLNTKRMLDLMVVNSVQGSMPLYMHVVVRILRDLRIEQQTTGTTFNYREFKHRLMGETLAAGQLGPLQQRLDTLESFMVKEQVLLPLQRKAKKNADKGKGVGRGGNDWHPQAAQLTIVDLSCPCVTAEMACSLFNVCLSLFLEQRADFGRVVALDEAHKYMTDTVECQTLTEALLSNIRLQRHLGLRVIISTQEPTISPRLLDLCSLTIVHRFTSPDWLQSLKKHLAGASTLAQATKQSDGEENEVDGVLNLNSSDLSTELFSRIVSLRRGEALLFAPSAVIGVRKVIVKTQESSTSPDDDSKSTVSNYGSEEAMNKTNGRVSTQLVKLGHDIMKVRIRRRVTHDGGKSILAV